MTQSLSSRLWRTYPAAIITVFAVLPIVIISILGARYTHLLRPTLSVELTNWEETRHLVSTLLNSSSLGDSWLPMHHALSVLRGPSHDLLYENIFFGARERFQYPPTSLLPLDLLYGLGLRGIRPLDALNSLFYLFNSVATAWFAFYLFRQKTSLSLKSATAILPNAHAMALLAAVLTFLFYPLTRALVLGQIQVWIDLLFTCSLILWVVDRRFLAGILIGLACTIKPQLGLLVVWGLLWREPGFVGGILLGSLPIGVVSVGRYGLHNHLAYIKVLSFLSRHGESFFGNNSVNGILNWYLSSDDSLHWNHGIFPPYTPLVYGGTLAATLFFSAIIVLQPLAMKRRRPEVADLGAAAICTVVSSPVAWEHHYGILLPLFIIALKLVLNQPARAYKRLRMAALFISWVLTADFISSASFLVGTPFVFLQAYCFFGAILLLILFLSMDLLRETNTASVRSDESGGSRLGQLRTS